MSVINCFRYYDFDPKNKVAEVEVLGDIAVSSKGDKECTNKIKIVREISWYEVLDLINIGKDNTGKGNTGNFNTGNYNTGGYCNAGAGNISNFNTGDCNKGCCNSGDLNTGNCNTGDYNTGNCNTGDYNTGSCNTGNYNTGYRNAGNYNSCNYSTGFFNSVEQPIYFFNKEVKLTRDEISNLKGLDIASHLKLSEWIYECNMTEEEKQQHPEYETTGGYLKTYTYKQAWANLWKEINEDDKQAIKDLPNFDKEVFKEITGITVK